MTMIAVIAALVGAESAHRAQSGPRLPPLAMEDLDAVQRELLGPRSGRVLNALRVYVRHPELYRNFNVFSRYIEGTASTLSTRAKEIVVLRTVWLTRDEYSWAYHRPAGLRAGLSEDEIERIARGPDAPGWSGFEAALVRAVDELHADQVIGDRTWSELAARYSDKELMDLIFTVGHRTMASMFHKSAGVELDPGITGFPK
jgi:alkylhydroperoxidase family enzyme